MSENEDIQAGFYRAKGVEGSAQFGFAKEGGEQIALNVTLLDIGRTETTILAFAGKARDISIERLKALGWIGDEALTGIGNNEIQVEVKYETYNGETKRRVEIKTRDGRFTFKQPMAEQQKRGFMSQLAKHAAQLGPRTQGAPAAGGAQGYPSNWDDNGPPPGASGGKRVDFG